MATVLQKLLDSKSPLFQATLVKLEKASGHSGVDVRLIADILERGNALMRKLRLDPKDTTPKELYKALQASVHNKALFDGTEFVGVILHGQVVSCNLYDVKDGLDKPFNDRPVDHFRRQLAHEIVCRYRDHARTDDRAVEQFARDAGLSWYTDDNTYANLKNERKTKSNMKRPYMLAIGDIFTDAFIMLDENTSKVTKDEDGKQWLAVEFGAKMPYQYVDLVRSVGPSPNAAVSFSRLGLGSGLMAYLGDDEVGSESIKYLNEQGVDTSTIVPQVGAQSSYWYVLRRGADRTMLVKNEEYDYTWNEPSEVPDWIYLSQLSPKSWNIHEKVVEYIKANPSVKLAFQPGTSHFSWGADKLKDIYKRSKIVIMNREEAMEVTGRPYDSVHNLAIGLHDLGPEIVVITDGPNGSYASYDFKLVKIPNYPDPKAPYDRTGAGDAFASTIVAALALGESMDTAFTWAPINSAYVVQHIGAQKGLLHIDELKQHLADAPDWYKIEQVEG